MHANPKQPRRKAFTLVELLVVIGIIALLVSILLPALGAARRQANTVKCLSNLRQFGQAIVMYANDNKGFLVPGGVVNPSDGGIFRDNWATVLVNWHYLKVPAIAGGANTLEDQSSSMQSVFHCPEGIDLRWGVTGNSSQPTSFKTGIDREYFRMYSTQTGLRVDSWYGINGWPVSDTATNADNSFKRYPFTSIPGGVPGYTQKLHKLAEFKEGERLVLLYDGLNFHNQIAYNISPRHNNGKATNVLLADGHCATIQSPGEIPMDTAATPTLKVFPSNGVRFVINRTAPGVILK